MKILITGGAGFIGSHLLEEFSRNGHELVSLDTNFPKKHLSRVTYLYGNFCYFEPLIKNVKGFRLDMVCHLGAVPSVKKSVDFPLFTMDTNVGGTHNVLEMARLVGARRVIFASSGAVYGETTFLHSGKPLCEDLPIVPLNPYGLSKKFGEEMMKMWADKNIWKNAPDTVSLRFSNVYGTRKPREHAYASCIEKFLHQWRSNEPFSIVPDGHQRRDMVFVKDVVRAIRLAAERPQSFEGCAINIGSGKNYSILEIADFIGGKDSPRVFIEPRTGEIRETLFDIKKAEKLLGWKPEILFEEGIEILKKES